MKLGKVIEIDKNNSVQIEDEGVYVIAGVQNYGQGVVNRRSVVGTELTMKKYQEIKPNQLMWCKVDTKNGAFGVTKQDHQGSLASTNMALANILLDKANPDFIQLLFQLPFFCEYINGLSTGTTNRKYLKVTEVLSKIEIPDMNLEQQNKFMKWYDIFKQEFDNLQYEDNKQFELLQVLRQSILQEAFQGKLVPQDPNDEPASVLLEKIKAEKEQLIKEKKIKKEKPLPMITEDEIPYELPLGWRWVRLGEVSKNVDYGTSIKSSSEKYGIPVLRMNNIVNGKIDFTNLKYIDEDIDDLPRLYLEEGDILFNRTNSYELVGKTGLFSKQSEKYTFASYLIRCSIVLDFLNSRYITYYMNSTIYRRSQIEPQIIQQNGQANFNGSKLKETLLPLPPYNEQIRIVEKVNQLMNLCDELEKNVVQSRQESQILMQSVLQQAFSTTDEEDNVVEFPSANSTNIEDWKIAARSDGEINLDTKSKIKKRVTELLDRLQ